MLAILEPSTLPIAIPELPLIAEIILTSNSGADVPKATIVIPITSGDMRYLRARATPPSTSQSPPKKSIANPASNLITAQRVSDKIMPQN